MKLTNYKGISGIVWSWRDVKFLCPSLTDEECVEAIDKVTVKIHSLVLAMAWEQLELSLASMGYEIEGTKSE